MILSAFGGLRQQPDSNLVQNAFRKRVQIYIAYSIAQTILFKNRTNIEFN